MRIAIVLCGDCGAPRAEQLAAIAGTDGRLDFWWIRDLCSNPVELAEVVAGGAEYVVVMGSTGTEARGALMEVAAGAGLFPLNLDFLGLPRSLTPQGVVALLRSTLAAAEDFRTLDERHVKPTNRIQGFVPRRSFLRGMRAVYVVPVPRIDASRCAADRGCDLCVTACPLRALVPQGRSIVLQVGTCTGCNRCLTACPAHAIVNPATDFERLRRRARAWLDAAPSGPRRLLLVCGPSAAAAGRLLEDGAGPAELLLEVPCLGALKAQEYVELLAMGFSEVVCVRDGKSCEAAQRCASGIPASLADILEAAGHLGWIREVDPSQARRILAESVRPSELPPHVAGFRNLHASVAWLLGGGAGRVPIRGRGAGAVTVDEGRCTLCLLCANRCPANALRVVEEGTEVRLVFRHASCDACGLCEGVCPEAALRLAREVRLDEADTETTIAADCWILCRNCGARVAPRRMIEKVRATLSIAVPGLDLCPDCKLFAVPDGPSVPVPR